ncbi:MAG: hypothetical protein ACOCRK_05130 [bacterium]
MKEKKIIKESDIKNVEILRKIANVILKNIPETKKDYTVLKGKDIKSELLKVVDKNNRLLDLLSSLNYYFIYYSTKSRYNGFFDSKNSRLLINVNNVKKNNESIKTTLVHELRHVLQYYEYPEFMVGELSSNVDYKKRKSEIDARFYELIEKYNPRSFEIPRNYATTILEKLISIMDLTDKQIKHYYKKTLDYFYQYNDRIKKDFIEKIIRDVFSYKDYTNAKSFLDDIIEFIYGKDFDKSMLSTNEEKRDYYYIIRRTMSYYKSNKKVLRESIAKTLYHGTLKKNVPSIMKYGIEPKVGEFTRSAYIEYEHEGIELPELVFAADKKGLMKTISAIFGAMEESGIPITKENFYKHAAIVVFKEGEDYFEYNPRDELDSPYITVEPEDYYREYGLTPDYVLTGKKLLRFLRKQNVNLERGFKNLDPESSRSKLIRNIVKKYPYVDKDKLRYMTIDKLKKL